MQSCISSNCSIMSRGKSRASVDTCGDCGLQGESTWLEFSEKSDKNRLCLFSDPPLQMPPLHRSIEVSNPVVKFFFLFRYFLLSRVLSIDHSNLSFARFRHSALLWLRLNSPFARFACDNCQGIAARQLESVGAQLHQSNQCAWCQLGVGARPSRSQLQAAEASAKSER